MSEQEEKKFYWRVFFIAWVMLFVLPLMILPILASIIYHIDINLKHSPYLIGLYAWIFPLYYIYEMLNIVDYSELLILLNLTFNSLLIERAYYLFQKWKMKRQAGGSVE